MTLVELMPYNNSTFAHGGIVHLLLNSYGFYQLGMTVMPIFGIISTLVLFTSAGIGSALLNMAVQKAYAEGRWWKTFKSLKAGPDPNPSRTLTSNHLGASGGTYCTCGCNCSPNTAEHVRDPVYSYTNAG